MIKVPKGMKFNKTQLKVGTKIELEHTTSRKRAATIAKQHMVEHPAYYKELVRMEKKLSKLK